LRDTYGKELAMVTKVRAIYEKGSLYLLDPVDWPEHTELEIQLTVTPSADRLGQLLREAARLGPVTPENMEARLPLLAAIREEMYRDHPEVGTVEEEQAKLLGFNPNDEEKMQALAESQHRAREAFSATITPFEPLQPIDVQNEDDLIYR
jgi:predicted DNA-binding antitoxin AbrB/MazE fold protein